MYDLYTGLSSLLNDLYIEEFVMVDDLEIFNEWDMLIVLCLVCVGCCLLFVFGI